jgi:hypothetical protein
MRSKKEGSRSMGTCLAFEGYALSVLGRFFEFLKNRLFWFCKYAGIKTKPARSDYFKN